MPHRGQLRGHTQSSPKSASAPCIPSPAAGAHEGLIERGSTNWSWLDIGAPGVLVPALSPSSDLGLGGWDLGGSCTFWHCCCSPSCVPAGGTWAVPTAGGRGGEAEMLRPGVVVHQEGARRCVHVVVVLVGPTKTAELPLQNGPARSARCHQGSASFAGTSQPSFTPWPCSRQRRVAPGGGQGG